MHKNATKCNETIGKWCKNKHGASKIIDTFETYHPSIHEHFFGGEASYLYFEDQGVVSRAWDLWWMI
jgi:hypothetical protein